MRCAEPIAAACGANTVAVMRRWDADSAVAASAANVTSVGIVSPALVASGAYVPYGIPGEACGHARGA